MTKLRDASHEFPKRCKHNDVSMEQSLASFCSCVNLINVKLRFLVYRKCFIGRETVDAIMLAGLAPTREDAVLMGRRLATRYDLFQHVDCEHEFKDENLLYIFKNTKARVKAKTTADGKEKTARRERWSWCSSSSVSSSCSRAASLVHSDPANTGMRVNLTNSTGEIIRTLRSVEVKDRRMNLRLFRQCFVGREAVDLLVYYDHAETRDEASLMLLMMNMQHNLFERLTGDQDFDDGNFFYRFNDAALSNMCTACAIRTRPGRRLSYSSMDTKSLEHVWIHIFYRVDLRDRRWRRKEYKNCFVGSELVDLLCLKFFAKSRTDAVRIARVVNSQCDLFEHVNGDLDFQDGYHFYRFKGGLTSAQVYALRR